MSAGRTGDEVSVPLSQPAARRKFWGWGLEGEGLAASEIERLGAVFTERLGIDGVRVQEPPDVQELDLPAPRVVPPASLEPAFSTGAYDRAAQRVGLLGRAAVPGQEPGERGSLGIGEDRLDRDENSSWGSSGHRGTSRPGWNREAGPSPGPSSSTETHRKPDVQVTLRQQQAGQGPSEKCSIPIRRAHAIRCAAVVLGA